MTSTRTRGRAPLFLLAATAVLALTGCASSPLPGTAISGSGAADGGSNAGSAATANAAGLPVAAGHGWTADGLDGTVPAPGSCHYRKAADGAALPDPYCTPGAVDAAVSDGNVSETVCRPGGYTSSVRPPSALTGRVKRLLLAAYGIPSSQSSQYELDHFVELNAGGSSDVRNLWPQPDTFQQFQPSAYVHNDKDAVEAYTYHALCQHQVTLSAVQRAIAKDWTTAVQSLGLPPIPADYRG